LPGSRTSWNRFRIEGKMAEMERLRLGLAALGIREGLHIQPIRIKEKVKNRSSLVREF
jgi:hypothetical protein